MLGRLLYKTKAKFGHGLRVAWYRDVVRPRILKTSPVLTDRDGDCEIHVLTSVNDWLNLLWALKSLYAVSRTKFPLCIHDDGSLDSASISHLTHHFPHARIISRPQADLEVPEDLKEFPRCTMFRASNHLAAKVFDFRHYLQTDRMLLLDSDVLFFREPTEFLQRVHDPEYRYNTVNGDVASAYTVDPAVVREHSGFQLIERFNSGLGLLHRESLQLSWIEEFLGLPNILGHFWLIEQTLLALCSSRFGVELLPSAYDVFLKGDLGTRASRHYVGAIRHLMYREGIARLNESLLSSSVGNARLTGQVSE